MTKITVVGAGKVGATVVQLLAYKKLGDIVLVNRTLGKAQGLTLDLEESGPLEGFDAHVRAGEYKDTKNSDVVIITAGAPRKEGQKREELTKMNAGIVQDAARQLARYSPEAVMIVVTNPLDIMAWAAMKASGFPKHRVVGMAGILDTARYCTFIADALGVSRADVQGMVLGGHGDLMVPLLDSTRVHGAPVTKLLSASTLQKIVQRTVDGGAEVIKLAGDSAFYAPASAVVQMVESIIEDRKRVLPCSAFLQGEYGIKGVFLGVPIVLGKKGVERILELSISTQEKKRLQQSAAIVQKGITEL